MRLSNTVITRLTLSSTRRFVVGGNNNKTSTTIMRCLSSFSLLTTSSSLTSSNTTTTSSTSLLNRYKSTNVAINNNNQSSSIDTSLTNITSNNTSNQSQQPFPSIVIGPNKLIQPQGTFAEAQAQFLDPDLDMVETLKDGLLKTNMGIVAHYYMDVELQGILQALKKSHPLLNNRIGIADSLKMGDLAVDMCTQHNVTQIICLGVDFMSESVQAILQKNGLQDIPVYRATSQAIGCSLAESAETDSYRAWLQQESNKAIIEDNHVPLHVIYINTSLETKAISSSIVPTITCTSSNVLQTLLSASTQIQDLRILYGPDTYMGHNLQRMLEVILESNDWTDAKIASELHPQHTNATLKKLHSNLIVFPQGNCIVHHMFGTQVVQTVKDNYYNTPNTYMTAHLEVPGEMFDIAMSKSLTDDGVVGSTSDILNFITRKVEHATTTKATNDQQESNQHQRLRFVLGTEAGMVTSIVKNVQDILDNANANTASGVEAEIIFPVSSEAIMTTDNNDDSSSSELPIVPGVAGGDGCSTAGGCATCPFMKMNTIDTLHDIIDMVDDNDGENSSSFKMLQKHLPPNRLYGKYINGIDATELGTEAILYMRQFMQNKTLPNELIDKVQSFGTKKE